VFDVDIAPWPLRRAGRGLCETLPQGLGTGFQLVRPYSCRGRADGLQDRPTEAFAAALGATLQIVVWIGMQFWLWRIFGAGR
jgi:hypothetical protein